MRMIAGCSFRNLVALASFFLCLLSTPGLTAQSVLSHERANDLIGKAICYLQDAQVKETVGMTRFKGEWLSTMMLDKNFVLLGKVGKSADDSNFFTSVSTYTILADFYEKHPEYEELGPMLDEAMANLMRYKRPDTDTFGFWQYFPKRSPIWTEEEWRTGNISLIRRSNNFDIDLKISNKAENVPDDADDTALAYIAFYKHRILAKRGLVSPLTFHTPKLAPLFDAFLDVKRELIPNVYNWRGRGLDFTGAYLTWFAREIADIKYGFPKLDRVYLPLGINDVDCVVNANILATLSIYNEWDESVGKEASCKYLRKVIAKKKTKVCGMYYPNWYTFHYNMSKAKKLGVDCVDDHLPLLVQDLLKHQKKEGYWNSYKINNPKRNRDRIQATVYALNALLRLGDRNVSAVEDAIQRAFAYLLSKAEFEKDSVHWKGGIFFTGGTIVRKTAAWRSSAYTTALVLEALSQYTFKT